MGKKRRRRKRIPKKVYLIYVDGESEIAYLRTFNSRNSPIKIRPELPNNKALIKQFEDIKDLVTENSYEKIFWLIDGDKVIHDGKVSTLRQIFSQVSKSIFLRNKVMILINNPCLEFWFLLHFKLSGKGYINCNQVIEDLRKISQDCEISNGHLKSLLSNYSKNAKKIEKLAELLKEYLKSAVDNATKLGNFSFKDLNSCAEIYKFFEELGIAF
jgi:ribosomal protein L22